MSISSGMQVIPPPRTSPALARPETVADFCLATDTPLIPADVRMRRRNSDASMGEFPPSIVVILTY